MSPDHPYTGRDLVRLTRWGAPHLVESGQEGPELETDCGRTFIETA